MERRRQNGSIRIRAGRVSASVPKLGQPGRRYEYAFPNEQAAQKWIDESVKRLERGLEPRPPNSRRRRQSAAEDDQPSGSGDPNLEADSKATTQSTVFLSDAGRAWHAEHFEEFERGNADTSKEALDDMEKHLFPVFDDLLRMERKAARGLVKDWLRTRAGKEPVNDASPFAPVARGYATGTVSRWLWILKSIIAYAAAEGDYPYADLLHGFSPLEPIGRKKRTPKVVTASRAIEIAACLHVVHQVVFWLLRAGGLRISEAYGLLVANFYVDDDGDGWLIVKAQGGKKWLVRGFDPTSTRRKQNLKTQSSYRVVLLAPMVTSMLEAVVEVFHKSPEGDVDMGARLIPALRSLDGGQEGFRAALHKAADAVAADADRPEDLIASLLRDDDTVEVATPHGLRKNYNTAQASDADVSEWLRRRVLGHKAADDVNSVYLLDTAVKAHLRPASKSIESELAAVTDSLQVPVSLRPLYSQDRAPLAVLFDARLEAIGWQVNQQVGYIGTAEAARLLGKAETTTRRMMGKEINAWRNGTDWLTTVEAVVEYRDRNVGMRFLNEIAEEAGADYHAAHRIATGLGLQPEIDPRTRRLLFTEAEAEKLLDEFHRLANLKERAVPVSEAAFLLGTTSHSSIHAWCRSGRLRYDDDADPSGKRYVTRDSVRAELVRRGKADTSVSVAEFQEFAEFDQYQTSSLVKTGILVRVRGGRLTGTSVLAYFTAFRPELLSSTLARRIAGIERASTE